jgi:prepilin-type N-terminal cleavage/methylation domain-containing protein
MTSIRHPLCLRGSRRALTLLEMMVAVTLLAMIMVGLLAMFNQTQKALRAVNAQSDIFENARGAIAMLSRDISEMTAYGETNVVNAYARVIPHPISSGTLPLPNGFNQPVNFLETYWLSRANDEWQGIGYFVDTSSAGVGTLYRFTGKVRQDRAPQLIDAFTTPSPTNLHRVSDGFVHFDMTAVFLATNLNGEVYTFRTNNFSLWTNDLPAYVDLELGVLEPATLIQFQALTNSADPTPALNFLRNHVGNIHFFRQRVPIRNYANPYRLNEVP